MSITRLLLDLDGLLVDFITGAIKAHALHGYEWQPGAYSDMAATCNIPDDEYYKPLDQEFWANLQKTQDADQILAMVEAPLGPQKVCILSSPGSNIGAYYGKHQWLAQHAPDYIECPNIKITKHPDVCHQDMAPNCGKKTLCMQIDYNIRKHQAGFDLITFGDQTQEQNVPSWKVANKNCFWVKGRTILGRNKYLFANKNTLLIDDTQKNTDAFIEAGGNAILVPRHWNSLHEIADRGQTLKYVQDELNKHRYVK